MGRASLSFSCTATLSSRSRRITGLDLQLYPFRPRALGHVTCILCTSRELPGVKVLWARREPDLPVGVMGWGQGDRGCWGQRGEGAKASRGTAHRQRVEPTRLLFFRAVTTLLTLIHVPFAHVDSFRLLGTHFLFETRDCRPAQGSESVTSLKGSTGTRGSSSPRRELCSDRGAGYGSLSCEALF